MMRDEDDTSFEGLELPKLRSLMQDDQPEWVESDDLLAILKRARKRPQIEIRTSVTFPDGRVVEQVTYEDEALWEMGYRQYYKVSQIMKNAEHVAARIAYDDDNQKGRLSG